jgi:hypothetical protein
MNITGGKLKYDTTGKQYRIRVQSGYETHVEVVTKNDLIKLVNQLLEIIIEK